MLQVDDRYMVMFEKELEGISRSLHSLDHPMDPDSIKVLGVEFTKTDDLCLAITDAIIKLASDVKLRIGPWGDKHINFYRLPEPIKGHQRGYESVILEGHSTSIRLVKGYDVQVKMWLYRAECLIDVRDKIYAAN